MKQNDPLFSTIVLHISIIGSSLNQYAYNMTLEIQKTVAKPARKFHRHNFRASIESLLDISDAFPLIPPNWRNRKAKKNRKKKRITISLNREGLSCGPSHARVRSPWASPKPARAASPYDPARFCNGLGNKTKNPTHEKKGMTNKI